MKKFFVTAAAAALIGTPAFAQQLSDSESFQINASVPGVCTIGNPGTFNMSELSVVTTAGSGALTLNALGTNGVRTTQNFWVSCNDTNRMTLTSANSNNLVLADGVTPTADEVAEGFTNLIAYAVGAQNYLPTPNQQPSLSNNVPFFQTWTRGAIHREVGMRVLIRSSDGPAGNTNATRRPLAGDYSDTVTVTVQIAA